MPIILSATAPSAPGATTNFTEWYREVLPECPGLDLAFALHIIRNTAIDFCTRTWAWKYNITGVMAVGTATYALVTPAETEVTGMVFVKAQRSLTGDETEVRRVAGRDVSLAPVVSNGAPSAYTIQRFDDLTFYPAANAAYKYTAQLALRPPFNAISIDSDVFVKYRTGIAHGALYALQAMPNKPWSSPSTAMFHGGEYQRAIRDAKIELNRGYAGEALMVDLNGGSFV